MASKDNKSRGVADLIRSSGYKAQSIAETTAGKGDLCETALDGRKVRIFNVLQYAEASWGLDMGLYPVQRFIVKLYYNLPLDDKIRDIIVTDMFKQRVLYEFTEAEYLKFLYNEGRCNIGEQDHMRRQLILPIGRRSGKCIVGDSLVLTDQGVLRLEDIGQAPEEDFAPVSIGIVQEAGRKSQAQAFYNGGVKQTFKVKTHCGYTITGTGVHRIKVMTPSGYVDWKYLDEIQVGDQVAINRGSDLWSATELDLRPYHNKDGYKDVTLPVTLDETLGNLIGYLVGDGTWGDDHAVSMTVEHLETWDHARSLFQKTFGEPRVQMDERTENTGRLEVCSVRARRFLDALGWKLDCARDEKMIPWAILRSPKPVVCAFLRGLFETDGCAENEGACITFSSASFRLAHEVQILLLNLGITCSVRRKWVKKTKKHYANLTIIGVTSRKLFADLIGFDSDKKRLPMLSALSVATEGKSSTDSIPLQLHPLRNWLESIPKRNPLRTGKVDGQYGWGRMKLRDVLGNTVKPFCGEDLTYQRLGKAVIVAKELGAGETETDHFEELLRLNYFYDPVTSVEESEDQVYDLTVPDGESFVANGFTNHNTTLSAVFASYELYRLISMGNPQSYYGLPNGNRIQVISVATDKDQAGLLFNDVTAHLTKCEFFKPYIANNTLSYVQFRTPYDIEKYGPTVRHENGKFTSFNGKASIRVTFKASVSKGLRGSGNIVIILDEMAHFQDKGISSAKDIYDAVTPSALAFSPKDPKNKSKPIGPVESRIISISSPLNRGGKFYELFHFAMSRAEGSENMLAIQAPTWEVNPTVEPNFLRQMYHEDPTVFMTEYGADFSNRVRAWIERDADLLECIPEGRLPKTSGPPRYPHQMGIDVGVTANKDGTALVVTHLEGSKVVMDYHEVWYAGTPWRDSNPHLQAPLLTYARGIENVERLDFDEISNWISELCKRFYITDGLFDRWNGLPLEQSLHKKGLKQFKSEFFTRDQKSRMFQAAKLTMMDHRLELYDYPLPKSSDDGGKHSAFITELLHLEATQFAKSQVTVEAPKIAGAHDDISDALIRAIWLSLEKLVNTKIVARGYPGSPRQSAGSMQHYQLARMRNHGVVRDRMVPRSMGRRLP